MALSPGTEGGLQGVSTFGKDILSILLALRQQQEAKEQREAEAAFREATLAFQMEQARLDREFRRDQMAFQEKLLLQQKEEAAKSVEAQAEAGGLVFPTPETRGVFSPETVQVEAVLPTDEEIRAKVLSPEAAEDPRALSENIKDITNRFSSALGFLDSPGGRIRAEELAKEQGISPSEATEILRKDIKKKKDKFTEIAINRRAQLGAQFQSKVAAGTKAMEALREEGVLGGVLEAFRGGAFK
jgi:hypothetical protein